MLIMSRRSAADKHPVRASDHDRSAVMPGQLHPPLRTVFPWGKHWIKIPTMQKEPKPPQPRRQVPPSTAVQFVKMPCGGFPPGFVKVEKVGSLEQSSTLTMVKWYCALRSSLPLKAAALIGVQE